jgi:Zn finger protein HypA/HybF involved in hydrogenase expression
VFRCAGCASTAVDLETGDELTITSLVLQEA